MNRQLNTLEQVKVDADEYVRELKAIKLPYADTLRLRYIVHTKLSTLEWYKVYEGAILCALVPTEPFEAAIILGHAGEQLKKFNKTVIPQIVMPYRNAAPLEIIKHRILMEYANE